MKKLGVVSTPLALALRSSSATRCFAAASAAASAARPRSAATTCRSSSVSVAERVISLTCARQKLPASDACSTSTAARRAMSLPVSGLWRKT